MKSRTFLFKKNALARVGKFLFSIIMLCPISSKFFVWEIALN